MISLLRLLSLMYAPIWDVPDADIPELRPPPVPVVAPDENGITVLEQAYRFGLLRILCPYAGFRIRYALWEKRPDEAVAGAVRGLDLSSRVIRNSQSLVDYMIGVLMLRVIVDESKLILHLVEGETLLPLENALSNLPDFRGEFGKPLQFEYAYGLNHLKSIQQLKPESLPIREFFPEGSLFGQMPIPAIFFQPNRTLRRFGEYYLEWLDYFQDDSPDDNFLVSPGFDNQPGTEDDFRWEVPQFHPEKSDKTSPDSTRNNP